MDTENVASDNDKAVKTLLDFLEKAAACGALLGRDELVRMAFKHNDALTLSRDDVRNIATQQLASVDGGKGALPFDRVINVGIYTIFWFDPAFFACDEKDFRGIETVRQALLGIKALSRNDRNFLDGFEYVVNVIASKSTSFMSRESVMPEASQNTGNNLLPGGRLLH